MATSSSENAWYFLSLVTFKELFIYTQRDCLTNYKKEVGLAAACDLVVATRASIVELREDANFYGMWKEAIDIAAMGGYWHRKPTVRFSNTL